MESKHWYTCENCGKNLSSYHSLWRHRKTCIPKHIEGKRKVNSDTTGSVLNRNRIVNDSSSKSSDVLLQIPSTSKRKPTVKILSPTTAGLWERFHKIYPEQKEKNRNELVSILDNLLRLGGICRKDYLHYNNTISGGEYNLAMGSGLYLQPYFR